LIEIFKLVFFAIEPHKKYIDFFYLSFIEIIHVSNWMRGVSNLLLSYTWPGCRIHYSVQIDGWYILQYEKYTVNYGSLVLMILNEGAYLTW